MKKICLILGVILISSSCQSKQIDLKGLPQNDKVFIESIFASFTSKLDLKYKNKPLNEQLEAYVADFANGNIKSDFLNDASIDTNSTSFKNIFIKELDNNELTDTNLENDKKTKPEVIEEIIIDENQKETKLNDVSSESFVLNPNCSLMNYFKSNLSSNFKVNNLIEMMLMGSDMDTKIISSGLKNSFNRAEYSELNLQLYVMIELYARPMINLKKE